MVSSPSYSSSSLPPSTLHQQDGLDNANMQTEATDLQKKNSINATTPGAVKGDDEKIIVTEHHHDEKSGLEKWQLQQQTDISQTLSDNMNQTPHKSAEMTQSDLGAMTFATSQLTTSDTQDNFEPTESSLANSPAQTSHHSTKDPAESQTRLISTNDGTTTQTILATVAVGRTETGQRDSHLSDNEPALLSSLSQFEQPDPSASSTTTTSSNQQKPSSQTTSTITTVTQQDETTGITVNENRNSQHQSPSLDHEYLVKSIDWLDPNTNTSRVVRIITQNENGPCPLVSICNVLFIRGDLNIRPFERPSVTFEYLLEILGDYLLNHAPSDIKTPESPSTQQLSSSPLSLDLNPVQPSLARQTTMEYVLTYRHNLDTALTILPRLQTGLDVNVQFSSIHDFEPTEELALFDLFGVDLVHGWIIDPQDEEGYRVVNKCKSYNGIVECIVRGAETNLDTNDNSNNKGEDVDETKMATRESNIHDGLVASQFLEDSATQLTYYGIELLTDTLPKNKLCVLFRNNHFSTLYKHPQTDRLYILVTDSGLVSEENIVWETLGDVDQGTSEFVNSRFVKPPPARARPTSSSIENQDRETADLDYAIALSLQQHQHEEIARNSPITNSNSNSIISPNHRNRISDSSSPHYPPNTSTTQSHTPLLSPPKKKNCIIS